MAGAASPNKYTNRSASKIETAGGGYIAGESPGLVTVAGSPASRRVDIVDIISGQTIGSTVSATDGTYRFDNLNPVRRYRVIAYDHTEQFNAVIRDNLTPAVDP